MCLVASAALAQATITGTVKDESGAVARNVIVEISGLALIEQRRTTIFRLHQARLTVSGDVYNLFNASAVLNQDNTFVPQNDSLAVWQKPIAILQARLLKLSAHFSF